MSVTDLKMAKAANSARHHITFPITTSVSQAGVVVGSWTPGHKFEVTKVSVFAVGVTANVSVDVQIAGASVLTGSIVPVAATETAGTLKTTESALRGSATQALTVKLTTDGTGAATNFVVRVQVRPYPLNGEVG